MNSAGEVKLADFGIACRISSTDQQRAGENGPAMSSAGQGSPYWMAPESIAGRDPPHPASDIWGWGCFLHELVTGYPPYLLQQLPIPAAVLRIVQDEHPPLPASASPGLVALLRRCWTRDLSARPSAEDLLSDAWFAEHLGDQGHGHGRNEDVVDVVASSSSPPPPLPDLSLPTGGEGEGEGEGEEAPAAGQGQTPPAPAPRDQWSSTVRLGMARAWQRSTREWRAWWRMDTVTDEGARVEKARSMEGEAGDRSRFRGGERERERERGSRQQQPEDPHTGTGMSMSAGTGRGRGRGSGTGYPPGPLTSGAEASPHHHLQRVASSPAASPSSSSSSPPSGRVRDLREVASQPLPLRERQPPSTKPTTDTAPLAPPGPGPGPRPGPDARSRHHPPLQAEPAGSVPGRSRVVASAAAAVVRVTSLPLERWVLAAQAAAVCDYAYTEELPLIPAPCGYGRVGRAVARRRMLRVFRTTTTTTTTTSSSNSNSTRRHCRSPLVGTDDRSGSNTLPPIGDISPEEWRSKDPAGVAMQVARCVRALSRAAAALGSSKPTTTTPTPTLTIDRGGMSTSRASSSDFDHHHQQQQQQQQQYPDPASRSSSWTTFEVDPGGGSGSGRGAGSVPRSTTTTSTTGGGGGPTPSGADNNILQHRQSVLREACKGLFLCVRRFGSVAVRVFEKRHAGVPLAISLLLLADADTSRFLVTLLEGMFDVDPGFAVRLGAGGGVAPLAYLCRSVHGSYARQGGARLLTAVLSHPATRERAITGGAVLAAGWLLEDLPISTIETCVREGRHGVDPPNVTSGSGGAVDRGVDGGGGGQRQSSCLARHVVWDLDLVKAAVEVVVNVLSHPAPLTLGDVCQQMGGAGVARSLAALLAGSGGIRAEIHGRPPASSWSAHGGSTTHGMTAATGKGIMDRMRGPHGLTATTTPTTTTSTTAMMAAAVVDKKVDKKAEKAAMKIAKKLADKARTRTGHRPSPPPPSTSSSSLSPPPPPPPPPPHRHPPHLFLRQLFLLLRIPTSNPWIRAGRPPPTLPPPMGLSYPVSPRWTRRCSCVWRPSSNTPSPRSRAWL